MTDAVWWIRSSDDAGTNTVCCVAHADVSVDEMTCNADDMCCCSVSGFNDVTAECVI